MEAFGLVEADFQQYYHLDLEKMREEGGFIRFTRLFENLPPHSRIMRKLAPANSWTWRDETLSRILVEISQLRAITYNSKRRKGQKAIKADEQFQPEYVADAKKEYIENQKAMREAKEDAAAIRDFWQARNPDVKIV